MNENKAMKVTQYSNNVFEDLDFDAEEAISLKVRADLMLDLNDSAILPYPQRSGVGKDSTAMERSARTIA